MKVLAANPWPNATFSQSYEIQTQNCLQKAGTDRPQEGMLRRDIAFKVSSLNVMFYFQRDKRSNLIS